MRVPATQVRPFVAAGSGRKAKKDKKKAAADGGDAGKKQDTWAILK